LRSWRSFHRRPPSPGEKFRPLRALWIQPHFSRIENSVRIKGHLCFFQPPMEGTRLPHKGLCLEETHTMVMTDGSPMLQTGLQGHRPQTMVQIQGFLSRGGITCKGEVDGTTVCIGMREMGHHEGLLA